MKTFSKKPLLYALAAFSIGVSFSSFAEIRNVTLLHTNDIESVYEPLTHFGIQTLAALAVFLTLPR
ncbi:hypothetical protein HC02_24750 [Vibrio parahaemolyticus]|nr:hypothetical protein HC02_24750 [Vibrio parahaemolyticus]